LVLVVRLPPLPPAPPEADPPAPLTIIPPAPGSPASAVDWLVLLLLQPANTPASASARTLVNICSSPREIEIRQALSCFIAMLAGDSRCSEFRVTSGQTVLVQDSRKSFEPHVIAMHPKGRKEDCENGKSELRYKQMHRSVSVRWFVRFGLWRR
jgi:hypothetical protein